MGHKIASMQRKLRISSNSSDLRRLPSAELWWRSARHLWLHMHAQGPNLQHWVKWTLTSLCILQQTLGAPRWKHGWILPPTSESWNSSGTPFRLAKEYHTSATSPSRGSWGRPRWTQPWQAKGRASTWPAPAASRPAEGNLPPVLGSALCHICSRSSFVAITRSKRHRSVVSLRAGHPGTALRICCTTTWTKSSGGSARSRVSIHTPSCVSNISFCLSQKVCSIPYCILHKFAVLSYLHKLHTSSCPCGNQPVGVFQVPILMAFCPDYSSGRTQFLIIRPHFFDLSSQNRSVCSPTHLDCKICPLIVGLLSVLRGPRISSSANTQSGGSPSLVCGICTWYASLHAFPPLFSLQRLCVVHTARRFRRPFR